MIIYRYTSNFRKIDEVTVLLPFNPAGNYDHALKQVFHYLDPQSVGFLVFVFVWMFTCHFYNGLVSGNIL